MWLVRRTVPSSNPPPPPPADAVAWRHRWPFSALALFVVVMAFLGWWSGYGLVFQLRQEVTRSLVAFVSIESVCGIAVILLLERMIPARPQQRSWSPSFVLDGLYVLVQLPLLAALLAFLSYPAEAWLRHHAAWVVIDPVPDLPWPVTLLLGLMVADFSLWAAHVAKHKVPFFWRFHIIHHSQENLNLFTANRTHPLDGLFEHFMGMVPAFLLFPEIVEQARNLVLFGLVVAWYIRFQHANIRLNLGPLRYLIVTPQSHRVHHSVDPAYWSSNFSNIFSLWDRIFRFQHPDVTSYPATGLCDPHFPEPATFSPRELARCYWGQLRYPFSRRSVMLASGLAEAEPHTSGS